MFQPSCCATLNLIKWCYVTCYDVKAAVNTECINLLVFKGKKRFSILMCWNIDDVDDFKISESTVTLDCSFRLEAESLYSIKLYKVRPPTDWLIVRFPIIVPCRAGRSFFTSSLPSIHRTKSSVPRGSLYHGKTEVLYFSPDFIPTEQQTTQTFN